MRLKTEIIIAAEIKCADSLGLYATVTKKGDEQAGQIYIIIYKNNQEMILVAPPFGATFDEDGQKLWCMPFGNEIKDLAAVTEYLDRIEKFDTDIYILEVTDNSLGYRPNGIFVLNNDTKLKDDVFQKAEKFFKN